MKEKCLNPTCKKSSYSRGLCYGCYLVARALIKSKEITEDKLLKTGRILPRKSRWGKKEKIRQWLLNI